MLRFPRVDPRDGVTLCRERPTVVMELEGRAPAKFSHGGGDTDVPSAAATAAASPASLFVMLHVAYP